MLRSMLVSWCHGTMVHGRTCQQRRIHDARSCKHACWCMCWRLVCCHQQWQAAYITLFTRSTNQKAEPIKVGATSLKRDDEANLGVTFAKRLTWKPHIAHTEARARRKLAIMLKLEGPSWETNEQVLMKIYQGTVNTHLEYGSEFCRLLPRRINKPITRLRT